MRYKSGKKFEAAKKTAQKVCGYGRCFCGYDCGHANKAPRLVPMFGKETVCPLAIFHVSPDKRPFFERSREENTLTIDDLWGICEICEHAKVEPDVITRVDFDTACIDCPVNAAIESVTEAEAEGRMS